MSMLQYWHNLPEASDGHQIERSMRGKGKNKVIGQDKQDGKDDAVTAVGERVADAATAIVV